MANGALRWRIEHHLEFIEFRLFWEGHVNRVDLMEKFDVSVNQASTDLNRYIGLAPDNMAYDRSARSYIRSPEFASLFVKPNANRYLTQLRSVADGILDQLEAWVGQFPNYDVTPTSARGVNAKIPRFVVTAIRRLEAIKVMYQSLSQPEPKWRWIAPHAIAFDGFRCHARSFCFTDRCYKDFLLSRIIETSSTRTNEITLGDDAEWNDEAILEIGPHPELSKPQQKVIALDYGMTGGKAIIPVRRALLYYSLNRLGLDTDPAARRPQDQKIVLLNRGQVLVVLTKGRGS